MGLLGAAVGRFWQQGAPCNPSLALWAPLFSLDCGWDLLAEVLNLAAADQPRLLQDFLSSS